MSIRRACHSHLIPSIYVYIVRISICFINRKRENALHDRIWCERLAVLCCCCVGEKKLHQQQQSKKNRPKCVQLHDWKYNYTSIARQKYARQFYQLYSIQATGISKWQTKHTWTTTKRKGKKLQSKADLTCTAYANWNEPIYPVCVCVCMRMQETSSIATKCTRPFPKQCAANHFKRLDCMTWHDMIRYDKRVRNRKFEPHALDLGIKLQWQGGHCGLWQIQKCCHDFYGHSGVYVKYVHSITLCSDFRKKLLFFRRLCFLFCFASRACRELSFVIITILSERKKNECLRLCIKQKWYYKQFVNGKTNW